MRRRSWRDQVLQTNIDKMIALMGDRAEQYGAEENPGPGAETGTVVKDYQRDLSVSHDAGCC